MSGWSMLRFVSIAVALAAFSLFSLVGALHSARPHHATGYFSGTAALRRLQALPIEAQTVISRTLGADQAVFRARRTSTGYRLGGGGLHMELSHGGARLGVGEQSLSMALSAVGRGGRLLAVSASSPQAHANRVLYSHAGVAEWYAAGPLGIEQGIILARRPAGNRGLVGFALALHGSLHAVRSGSQVELLGASGQPVLRYGGLSASDARGRHLPAWFSLSGRRLLIRVDDQGARYPLRIDPFIQQGTSLGDLGEGNDFGLHSLALSADGDTALIGGPGGNEAGAAWIFTRSGSTWSEQAKLTGSGEICNGYYWCGDYFGYSVALSADGNTALIGGYGDAGNTGAAWVFTRSGSIWTQQGSKLTGAGEVGEGRFGESVALSADGNTALIGGPDDYGYAGAAWVFTRSGSTWTQEGSKLRVDDESEGEEGRLGDSVALSADGDTALIGGALDNHGMGAAWVFTRSGSTWMQQGSKLTGAGEVGEGRFGESVALSANGDTALIGGLGDNEGVGAAWAFNRSGATWTQQGEKLTTSGESIRLHFGYSLALSADGDTALIGGDVGNVTGAPWVFTRSGATWTQRDERLTGSGESGSEPTNVALSADGDTALFGELSNGPESAWVFVAGPEISSPSNLSVGPQAVGKPGPVLWLEVQNAGAAPLAPLTFTGPAQITGVDASDFAIPSGDDGCYGETLQGGQACRIGVQFTASATGSRSATLSFGANNGSPEAPTVALSGTGVLPPIASFTISQNANTAGITIGFNAGGSNAPDGSIERYSWSFGDGTSAEGMTPSHTYTASGTYAVTLTVTDNDGLAMKVTHSVTVREAQTIELLSNTPTSAAVGGPTYVISAAATSGLPLSLSSGTPTVCSLAGSSISFITPGACTIDADQAGNAEYGPAPEAQWSFPVNKGSQLITFTSTAPASAAVAGLRYILSATASSGLPVSFASATPSVCELEGMTASFLATGTCTIDGNQAGNSNYNEAPQAQQSFTVGPPLTPPVTARFPHALTPLPNSSFSLLGSPTTSSRTGAVTFTVSVADPGTFSWILTFPNGKFGVFSASKPKCKTGQIRLSGNCRPVEIVFGKGSAVVAAMRNMRVTVKPSASATTALQGALKKGRGLPVTAYLTFQSALGGNPVSHVASITLRLKKTS